MRYGIRIIAFLVLAVGISACNQQTKEPQQETPKANTSSTVIVQLKDGNVEIELRPDLAPKHVERISTLANQGFYDGVVFHRVIEGFMAQGGDPTGTGSGGSELPDLPAEFSAEPFDRGVLGMARSQSPNSANSQFFIMLAEGHFLNNQYTVFGKVTKGMEYVDSIKKGNSAANGAVTDPDKIIKMRTADQF